MRAVPAAGAATAGVLLGLSAFFFMAFRPGVLSLDPLDQLRQGLAGEYDNLNPPLLSALLAVAYRVCGSVWPILLLQLGSIFGGMAVLLWGAHRNWTAPAFLACFMMLPPVWSTSVVIWKDVAMACGLMLSVVALQRRRFGIATGILVMTTTARLNAVLATMPLLAYAVLHMPALRTRTLRVSALAAALVAAIAAPKVVEVVFHARDAWGLGWVLGDDLAAMYARRPDLFAGSMLEGETSPRELASLYDPNSSTKVFFAPPGGPRGISLVSLPERRASLMKEWARVVIAAPVSYLRVRWVRYCHLLGVGIEHPYFPFQPTTNENAYGLSSPEHTPSHRLARWLQNGSANTILFRGWFWVLALLVVGVVALRRWRASGLALAVTASGTVYALGYFPFAPAADFRYLYWSIVSVFAGLAVVRLGAEGGPTPTASAQRD